MASKRMKNRLYWAACNALAANHRDAFRLIEYVHAAHAGMSDRNLLAICEDALLDIEAEHGPAGIRQVHKRELWPHRQTVDRIIQQ